MLSEHDKVWAPDPDDEGEVRGTFHEIAVGEPIEINAW
jgi:hypothetical protein